MKYNCNLASGLSLLCDCALALLKFIVGLASSSHSLVSDAVHSCADALSCIIVLLGINASRSGSKAIRRNAEKIELLSLLMLSAILIITGLGIGTDGIRIIFKSTEAPSIPEVSALCVAIFSLAVKEALFIYNIRVANKSKNELIRANAWHHQSDALSCLGSFVGILGARLGYPFLDPMASVAISLLIIKVGIQILITALKSKKGGTC
ncbi:MAG: cation diffusion facilitator family transporter [Ruminococcaceae bacterium]|nr:cation diffusion facilitator family transporter [Oscillospiraceae bacterium]